MLYSSVPYQSVWPTSTTLKSGFEAKKSAALLTFGRSADATAYWSKPKYIVTTMSSGLMFSGSKASIEFMPRSCSPESAIMAASEGSPPGLSSLPALPARVSRGEGPSIESQAASINIENARAVRAIIFFIFFYF